PDSTFMFSSLAFAIFFKKSPTDMLFTEISKVSLYCGSSLATLLSMVRMRTKCVESGIDWA
ncbi:MAG: hypothetical protein ACRC9L_04350, partial [Brevinema sp.]